DGAGNAVVVVDGSDIPAPDGNDCTMDMCSGPIPIHVPVAAGSACTQGGGVACNGSGACVQGLAPFDCPAFASDCQAPPCTAVAGGLAFSPAGTVVSMQDPGDCRVQVCDGSGSYISVPDDTALPVGNACSIGLCTSGDMVLMPMPAGTACADHG